MALTAAEQEELDALEDLQEGETFEEYVKGVRPQYWPVPPHLQPLYDLFQRMRYERIFATISMPPRHGKTTSVGLGIGHRVKWDPACLNFYCTYAQTPAEDKGYDFQKVAIDSGVPLRDTASLDWRTHFDGGLKSTSELGQITGYGANGGLVTIDDLLRGRMEADSLLIRDRKWDWFKSDALTRAEGGSSILMVQTRWHPDDPIGRIKKETGRDGKSLGRRWVHINCPAVHDGNFSPVDERINPELAHPLWLDVDSMFPGNREAAMEWYAMARATGEREWWSLYQGVPRSDDTTVYQQGAAWFHLPLKMAGMRGCIVMDPAATKSTKADYTAIGVCLMEGYGRHSKMYIRRAMKKQVTIPHAARIALKWHQRWRLPLAIESVGAFAAIPDMIEEIAPELRGRIVRLKPGSVGWIGTDKLSRSGGASAAWNEHRVLLPHELDANGKLLESGDNDADLGKDIGWQDDFVRVVNAFTGIDDPEDDLVDMMNHGWNVLYREAPRERFGSYTLEGGAL